MMVVKAGAKGFGLLKNYAGVKGFAGMDWMFEETMKAFWDKLLDEPDVSDAAYNFAWGKERSQDFKAYHAGREFGRKDGHKEGFSKGAAVGVVIGAVLAAVGTVYLQDR